MDNFSEELKRDFAHLNDLALGKRSLFKSVARNAWGRLIQWSSLFYVKIEMEGDWDSLREHSNLIVIANHSSHLDGALIQASLPHDLLEQTYFVVARDYFFQYKVFAEWAKTCLNGIPMDRGDEANDATVYCIDLMKKIRPMWTVIFPEGTRSMDGKLKPFKKGVSLMSRQSDTPVVFLYLRGAFELFPKGKLLPRPGTVKMHIGPVIPPESTRQMEELYLQWLGTLDLDSQS